jgi:hypothetical protein
VNFSQKISFIASSYLTECILKTLRPNALQYSRMRNSHLFSAFVRKVALGKSIKCDNFCRPIDYELWIELD